MGLGKKLAFSTVQEGEKVDVIDNECIRTVPIHGIWTEAVIVRKTSDSVVVHYLCWDTQFDEVIPRSQFSHRVRTYGSKTFIEGGVIRRHNRLDVLDTHPLRNKWCTGYVVDAREKSVLIHFKGFDKKFDQWFNKLSSQLAPYGRRQFPHHDDLLELRRSQDALAVNIPSWGPSPVGAFRPSSSSSLSSSSSSSSGGGPATDRVSPGTLGGSKVGDDGDGHGEDEAVAQAEQARQMQVYIASLYKNFGLRRKAQDPDGNCLFRSISDQIYGDPRYHTIVREYTVDYMQVQRNSFQPFVAPSMRDFEVYLKFMRCNGTNYKAVWGGEPELQAMSELYQRHIIVISARRGTGEAYVHAEYGTGFKGNRTIEPIRLNFYQYGHYDSAVPLTPGGSGAGGVGGSGRPPPRPGQIELAMLKLLNAATTQTAGNVETAESQQLLAAIAESRKLWHSQSAKAIEQALKQSVEVEDQRALQMAMEASSKQASSGGLSPSSPSHQKRQKPTTESKEDTAEMDLVLAAVNQSLADQQRDEQKALDEALALSRQQAQGSSGGGVAGTDAAVLQTTLAASEQQDAESALLQSTLEASARDAKVEQLVAIMMPGAGGAQPEYVRKQAQFFLESANWDVEVAVANLFSTF